MTPDRTSFGAWLLSVMVLKAKGIARLFMNPAVDLGTGGEPQTQKRTIYFTRVTFI